MQVANECGKVADTVVVDAENCDCIITVPNAFSPNGDSKNDQFIPVHDCDFVTYELAIFNRWGEQIFVTTDSNTGWDGIYKGKLLEVNTYIYILTYSLDDGVVRRLPGTVILIH